MLGITLKSVIFLLLFDLFNTKTIFDDTLKSFHL